MASLTPNREAPLAALWWLFSGALFFVELADTSGATTPPALNAPYNDWLDYLLFEEFFVAVTAGQASYDSTLDQRGVLPQLEFVLDFSQTVTYTDILITAVPVVNAGASAPNYVLYPLVGVIHETAPVTLTAAQTKTYKLDLFSEWF